MAGSGQPHPPDPGGSQKGPLAYNSCWPPLEGTSCPSPAKNLTPPARSFVSVTKAQNECVFPTIQLAARKYGTKDGKPVVQFTPSELQVGIEHLRHALVAKFSGGRPVISEVRQSFTQAWVPAGRCSIGALDAKHILVVLDSDADARKILVHPMRKLGHSLFRLFRWSKEFSSKTEPTSITTWVRLVALPPELNNPGYIESIVGSFGKFLAVDTRTRTFNNPNYARVCMEVDSSKELPEAVWVATGIDSGFWEKVIFENRISYCTKCRLHGHDLKSCRKHKKRQIEEQAIWAERDEHGLPITTLPASVAPQQNSQPIAIASETQQKAEKGQEWIVVQNRKKNKSYHQKQKEKQQAPCPETEVQPSPTEHVPKVHQPATLEREISNKDKFKEKEKDKDHPIAIKGHVDLAMTAPTLPSVEATTPSSIATSPKEQQKQGTSDPNSPKANCSSSIDMVPFERTVPGTEDDEDLSCMPFAQIEALDSEKALKSYSVSVVSSPQGLITTVVRNENTGDLSDEELIPHRKLKQRWKMGRTAEKYKLEGVGEQTPKGPMSIEAFQKDTSKGNFAQNTSGPSNVQSLLNVRADPFHPGHPPAHLNATHPTDALADPAGTMSTETTPLSASNKGNNSSSLVSHNNSPHQRKKDLPPLTYFRRTRDLDNVKINDDFALQSRRDNPYID